MPAPKDPEKYRLYIQHMSESHKGLHAGEKHPMFGKQQSPESIEKRRQARIGKPHPHCGHVIQPHVRQKISQTLLGHTISQETRDKISTTLSKKLPELSDKLKAAWADPIRREKRLQIMSTDEYKEKISRTSRERWINPEYKANQSGENAPNWNGGSSFEPYCVLFNDEFKERVRAFFDYTCIECGTPQNGHRVGVHHVNFNKQACCDDSVIPLFVTLCKSCHGKTSHVLNRDYWEKHFTDIVNQYYEGKCYFSKLEYAEITNV